MSWRASGGIKRWAADKWFSLCIRHKAEYTCESCGNGATDCAHIFGRADFTVRWCKLNALALCRHCHDRFGQHPLLFAELVDAKWPDRRTMLQVKRRGRLKNNAETRKLISDHYRKQYRAMQSGESDDFESWN